MQHVHNFSKCWDRTNRLRSSGLMESLNMFTDLYWQQVLSSLPVRVIWKVAETETRVTQHLQEHTAHLASRPWKLKIKNRSSRFKNVPHMWMKQSWVRWDNYQPILFLPICCKWRLSQVKIISWQYLKLLLWQKIRFYNGIWLFKMYRRFQWNTNESKSISPCQICLMECQFSIANRRWTELLGPEVPVSPTVHCTPPLSPGQIPITGCHCNCTPTMRWLEPSRGLSWCGETVR